jgi:hypothetical protein
MEKIVTVFGGSRQEVLPLLSPKILFPSGNKQEERAGKIFSTFPRGTVFL